MGTLKVVDSTHMNCSWQISYFPQSYHSEVESSRLVSEAFQVVKRFENYFTVFKDSPFNKLNKYAGKKEVSLSIEAIDILKKSIEYYKKTEEFFNICFQSSKKFSPLDIEIDEDCSTAFLPNKEMSVSLGGIGKGHAVDICFEFLKKEGFHNFMVNGSGDLRTHSHPDAPRPWKIGVTNPFNIRNQIGIINMKNGAVATSGSYLKKNHIKSIHENTPLAVTVQSMNTTEADVCATYLSSLDISQAKDRMEKLALSGFIIDKSGNIHRSTHSFKRN
ncbi:FAD:protein FMN transferase [Halobacteriovorax sp.]|mgnify:CR=1 FL=1|uniref:FAD:protein FMN transferase n=1 Tax=Halobacteriovorax sp. TaxID=2020862 RepID=UPI00356B1FF6